MKKRSRGSYNNLAANLNIQEFIETVKDRPAIWSRFMHCNKSFVDDAWEELSKIHNVSSKYIYIYDIPIHFFSFHLCFFFRFSSR